ncbi:MAG: NAD(P)H-dependent oxidoreductase [Flavobacteriaceae bacterium]|nr:NAD(P)H-dependent oxidoreductase [Flavobacteriaceae bacterium]
MKLIEDLNWRYATKQFDASKKVSQADLEQLKESIRLSASSYGLQLYKVLIIEDKDIKEQLKPASYGQGQITDASHLFVFCNYATVSDNHTDQYLQLKAKMQDLKIEDLQGYGDFIKGSLSYKSEDEMNNWTAKQTYIALGNLLIATAELKIDSCPMEGFEPEKYNKILGLDAKGLNASVVVAVGYRSVEDQTQFDVKVRKSKAELFETI